MTLLNLLKSALIKSKTAQSNHLPSRKNCNYDNDYYGDRKCIERSDHK
jgi:hypothetical protein